MERNDGVRRVLSLAPVYRGLQRVLGSHKSCRRLATDVIRSTSTSVIVDIGCGTADIVDFIEFGEYIGFDPNPSYVEEAGRRVGDRGRVAVARVGESLLNEFLPARADIVIMMGVLHHMDDALACRSLRLAAGLLTDGGRFVAFDPGIVAGQPAIARFLAERDRGQHVRDVDATRTLLNQAFSQVDIDVHHDFLALPYTHIVAEATGPIVADGTSVSDARSI